MPRMNFTMESRIREQIRVTMHHQPGADDTTIIAETADRTGYRLEEVQPVFDAHFRDHGGA